MWSDYQFQKSNELMYVSCAPSPSSSWDTFVDSQPQAAAFHKAGWLAAVSKSFAVVPYFVEVRSNEKIQAVLGLYAGRSLIGGCELRSTPGGILGIQAQAVSQLLATAEALRDRLKFPYLRIEHSDCILPHTHRAIRSEQVTTVVDLNAGSDHLWKMLSSNTRRKIRKAEKNGYRFGEDIGSIKRFYTVYAKNMLRLGTPVFSFRFFKNIIEQLPDHIKLFTIAKDGVFQGGMLCIISPGFWRSMYVGMESSALRGYATYLLYWNALSKASASEVGLFDLGTSVFNSGTFTFKQQWCGRNQPAVSFYFPREGAVEKTKRVSLLKKTKSRKAKLWQGLPLPLANAIGPLLRRSFPMA